LTMIFRFGTHTNIRTDQAASDNCREQGLSPPISECEKSRFDPTSSY
jgi:hypothetical protein